MHDRKRNKYASASPTDGRAPDQSINAEPIGTPGQTNAPPVPTRSEDAVNWDWLRSAPALGRRLMTIRRKVKELHQEHEMPLAHYTPHGVAHLRAVEDILHRLLPGQTCRMFSEDELFFLLASAWLHDIGMLKGIFPSDTMDSNVRDAAIRNQHHTRSEDFITDHFAACGLRESEAAAMGILARFHRRRASIEQCCETLEVPGHGVIRPRLLAAFLRLADAMHVDITRTPAHEYAISLAYDIPAYQKLHWVRSKFVLGVTADPARHEIMVYLKKPIALPPGRQGKNIRRMLESLYRLVLEDMNSELESVKDVLVMGEGVYYVHVRDIHVDVAIDSQLERDYQIVANYYDLLENPSSSAIVAMLLQTLGHLTDQHRTPSGSWLATHDASRKLIDEIKKSVLPSRSCHGSLARVVRIVDEHLEQWKSSASGEAGLPEFTNLIKGLREQKGRVGRDIRYQACGFARATITDRPWPKWKFKSGLGKPDGRVFAGDGVPEPITLLLYGYSELVMKAVCGFRDAIAARICERISEEATNRHVKFHQPDIEALASRSFRIYVCEGQPKNRTGWAGRILYHDGIRYAQALHTRKFDNVYVIPDAIAATLMVPAVDSGGNHQVHYVLIGANGFDNGRFVHSAGHGMIVALAAMIPRESSALGDDSVTDASPRVILVTSSDKLLHSSTGPGTGQARSEKIVWNDGYAFAEGFCGEKTRSSVFVSQDLAIKRVLADINGSSENRHIAFYNPREEYIPFEFVDYVITELGCYDNSARTITGALLSQTDQPPRKQDEKPLKRKAEE